MYRLLLVFILMACGSRNLPPTHTKVDDIQVEMMTEEFIELCNKSTSDLIFRCMWNSALLDYVKIVPAFNIPKKEQNPNAIAYCTQMVTGIRRIELLESYWMEASYIQRKQVLFHELSHCLLDKDHLPGDTHIMSAETPHEWYIEHHWKKMVNELFETEVLK